MFFHLYLQRQNSYFLIGINLRQPPSFFYFHFNPNFYSRYTLSFCVFWCEVYVCVAWVLCSARPLCFFLCTCNDAKCPLYPDQCLAPAWVLHSALAFFWFIRRSVSICCWYRCSVWKAERWPMRCWNTIMPTCLFPRSCWSEGQKIFSKLCIPPLNCCHCPLSPQTCDTAYSLIPTSTCPTSPLGRGPGVPPGYLHQGCSERRWNLSGPEAGRVRNIHPSWKQRVRDSII